MMGIRTCGLDKARLEPDRHGQVFIHQGNMLGNELQGFDSDFKDLWREGWKSGNLTAKQGKHRL
jgi:hypothetical protein